MNSNSRARLDAPYETAMLLGLEDIREVIAFLKTQKATCLLTDAPAGVDEQQLKELGLKISKP